MTEKEMLIELLKNFYVTEEGLMYSWREDVSVGDQDKQLEKHLIEFIKENNIRSY
jgi:hypothetical protein